MGESLLPPSLRGDARSVAFEALLGRLDALPLSLLRQLYTPSHAPLQALPALAQQWGVLGDAWALARSEAEQRALVSEALTLQQLRGTPWALSRVLTLVGWPGGLVQERLDDGAIHDRSRAHGAEIRYGGRGAWATFRVMFDLAADRPVSAIDVARAWRAVEAWSPVGRHCRELGLRLKFTSAGNAAATTSLQLGGVTVPILRVVGSVVYGRIKASALQGVDLRTFRLLTSAGAVVAEVTRPASLIKANATLYIEWSVS